MTRINCVPPQELSGPHLVAEYRELPRIFGLVRAAISRGEHPDDPRNPEAYQLGAGHVRFFYPRLAYLARRQGELIAEMKARGYAPAFTEPQTLLDGIPTAWLGEWNPTPEALEMNRARIAQRMGAREIATSA